MSDSKVSGGCLCGGVQYDFGEPTDVWYCHCESCRRATGAPVTAWAMAPATSLSWTKGEQTRYESSPGVYRGFCRDCGTPLSYETLYQGETVFCVLSATLNEPDKFPPNRHVFHAEHISWVDMGDGLAR